MHAGSFGENCDRNFPASCSRMGRREVHFFCRFHLLASSVVISSQVTSFSAISTIM